MPSAQNIIDFLSSDQNECFDISSKYDTQATYDIVVMRYAINRTDSLNTKPLLLQRM